jgi:DNA-binding CsgD family transcriptional regulator/tetratricopeptide (TPR) repeat protein
VEGRSVTSPVLVGRDELLSLGERRATAARNGAGHMLFLAGEAGIGKTRLLGATIRRAERVGLRSVVAAAFPRDIEIAGAVLLDLGDQLARAADPAWADLGHRLRTRMSELDVPIAGDHHRQRRLLVLDVVDTLARLADQVPTVIALEDLHWADDLTLEVLGQVARRLADRPLLVLGTYRSDELYPRVPMREWRNRLLAKRLAEEAVLPRLSVDQTGKLATYLLGGALPAPRDLVARLHRRSDGIPLHVEELLGAMRTDGMTSAERLILPDTLAEAVQVRAAQLTPAALRVARTAAVIGRSFDIDLLVAVHGGSAATIGRAMAELERRFFLVDVGRGWFDVRHALIRDAMEASIDPAHRRALHRRVAEATADRRDVGSDAFLSAHYELGGIRDRAFHHARLAAARAAALSSHREALELFRRALRTAPATLPPRERAALLRTTAIEEAATDDNRAAATSLEAARRILHDAGDAVAAAELLPPLVAARHLLGDGLASRASRLETELARLGPDAPAGTRARLLAALSAVFMLDRRLDEAIANGEASLALARADGDLATQLHVAATVGPSLAFAGRMEEAWSMLENAVATAREGRREAEAARAYRMIGSSASVLVEPERALRWLRAGIEYAERTEQWNHRHYMTAHLAHVEWARGDWDAASRLAEHALADGRGGITTTITALHVLGFVALGRGELGRAEEVLTEARRLGIEMRELQRFSPAIWGLAEAALLAGRPAEAIAMSDDGLAASAAVRDAAYLFPFLVTGTRARLGVSDAAAAERWVSTVSYDLLDRAIPGTLPAIDHARGLLALAGGATGRARDLLASAHDAWNGRERWWEGHWAAVDLARCLRRSNRPADAARLLDGVMVDARERRSQPLLDAAQELTAQIRVRRPVSDPWSPLSAREVEVARLIAKGRTNREIADELAISPKTVSAHVEHILARLGASRRAEIAAWVTGLGR